jgi:hypothetical protein
MIQPVGRKEAILAAFSRQKEFVMRRTEMCLRVVALICAVCSCAWAQHPGWPRKLVKPGGTVIVYQPQVDDWQNFTDIKWRAAFQLTPSGVDQKIRACAHSLASTATAHQFMDDGWCQ